LVKVNYQNEKRKRELAKKRKKAQKEHLKELKKNTGFEEIQGTNIDSENTQETPPAQPSVK